MRFIDVLPGGLLVASQYIRLRGLGPEFEGKAWESTTQLRVGRAPKLEIQLADSSISRCHAEIVLSDQGWMVRDLGSRNGTFLNGIRVGQIDRKIQQGDLLQCGNIVLAVTALQEDLSKTSDTKNENWQVQATAQHSWEEALQLLALDVTRKTDPGEQLLMLLRTAQHLYQVSSFDDLLRLSLQDAASMLKAQRGCVLLYDSRTGNLIARAVFDQKHQAPATACYSRTLAERCFQRQESLLCNDVRNDPELLEVESLNKGAMSSIICALLRTPRKRLGVLHLDRGPGQDAFTTEEFHLADGVAAGMSASVASAQLMQEKQRNVFFQTVVAFAQALELRDPETSGHAQRVTDFALLLGEELEVTNEERECLQIAGSLHDIGKIGVDDRILHKPTALAPSEIAEMQEHSTKGAALLQAIPDLAHVSQIVRSHHERWDGKGYPDGLAGERIPKLARLIAVADTFDALTYDSSFRRAVPPSYAFEQIREGAGTQLDPHMVEAFIRVQPEMERRLEERQKIKQRPTFP